MEYSESFDELLKVDQSILSLTQKERVILRGIIMDSKSLLDFYPIKHTSNKYTFIKKLLGVL